MAGAALGVAVDASNDNRNYRRGYNYRQPQSYYNDGRYRTYDRGYYGRTNNRYGYGYDNYGYRR